MAKLESMWIDYSIRSEPTINLDWNNDRHQSVKIKGSEPEKVIFSIEELVQLLKEEKEHGNLG